MTKQQQNILLFFCGILFLSLTYFREAWFTQTNTGLWIYRLLAFIGLILLAGGLGRFLNKKWSYFFIALLFFFEIFFAGLFQWVKKGNDLPQKGINFLSYIYLFHCRDYIIYDQERGQYNDELFYTLKPGKFEYNNMEFSTNYQVNKKGFRDDERSLINPEIIFLGDSYTMGWGVEQSESFANILEKRLQKKTLNLGIASYGTAREYLAFNEIDRDSCQLVILQFCPNDIKENKVFVENNFQLNISSEEKFKQEIIWNKIYKIYFPLKYIHSAISFFVKKIKPAPSKNTPSINKNKDGISTEDLNNFFIILEKIKNNFNGKIIIFNLGMNVTTPTINQQFNQWILENKSTDIFVFNSTDYLNEKDYLPLDTHLKKSGNKKIAKGLEEFILKNKLLQ